MKAGTITVTGMAVLAMLAVSVVGAEPQDSPGKGYMGILLDERPLPEILEKHLRLSEGQGIRIDNVQVDSPADKAGLERDDIIIGFQDADVDNHEDFVAAVAEAGAGTEVSLKIIHLGKRKTVKLTLADRDKLGDTPEWKYLSGPEISESWRPGRMFRLRPGDMEWHEIPWEDLPDVDIDIQKHFDQVYTFHHIRDGKRLTITIKGDPRSDKAWITVQKGNTEYKAMVKDIDELPAEYRQVIEEALQNARKTARRRPRPRYFDRADEILKELLERGAEPFDKLHFPPPQPGFDRDASDEIRQQMRRLKEQMEQLQKSHKEILKRLEKNQPESRAGQSDEGDQQI